jgi:hypothetical protein
MSRTYRTYTARLEGSYRDIRDDEPAVYVSDHYSAGQILGEAERASGGDGFVYRSVRRRGGTSIVAYRPSKVLDVTHAAHYRITVLVERRRIDVEELAEK